MLKLKATEKMVKFRELYLFGRLLDFNQSVLK